MKITIATEPGDRTERCLLNEGKMTIHGTILCKGDLNECSFGGLLGVPEETEWWSDARRFRYLHSYLTHAALVPGVGCSFFANMSLDDLREWCDRDYGLRNRSILKEKRSRTVVASGYGVTGGYVGYPEDNDRPAESLEVSPLGESLNDVHTELAMAREPEEAYALLRLLWRISWRHLGGGPAGQAVREESRRLVVVKRAGEERDDVARRWRHEQHRFDAWAAGDWKS